MSFLFFISLMLFKLTKALLCAVLKRRYSKYLSTYVYVLTKMTNCNYFQSCSQSLKYGAKSGLLNKPESNRELTSITPTLHAPYAFCSAAHVVHCISCITVSTATSVPCDESVCNICLGFFVVLDNWETTVSVA